MKSLTPQKRPSYNEVDIADREAQLGSRTNVLGKSFATDLWIKVIIRAIDDAALYKFMKLVNKTLNEEEQEDEKLAWSFLFNDDHRVPMGDYLVDVICPKCNGTWSSYMSHAAGSDSICIHCGHKTSWKYTTYQITNDQGIVDISLQELISLWSIEDLDGFRKGCRRRINEIVAKKLKSENKRISKDKLKTERTRKAK